MKFISVLITLTAATAALATAIPNTRAAARSGIARRSDYSTCYQDCVVGCEQDECDAGCALGCMGSGEVLKMFKRSDYSTCYQDCVVGCEQDECDAGCALGCMGSGEAGKA